MKKLILLVIIGGLFGCQKKEYNYEDYMPSEAGYQSEQKFETNDKYFFHEWFE